MDGQADVEQQRHALARNIEDVDGEIHDRRLNALAQHGIELHRRCRGRGTATLTMRGEESGDIGSYGAYGLPQMTT